ncbi:MAG: hypothetical protein HFH91_07815 [Lachnospiraceae bacterium]|nr:hypothetical protein [Lachnospiraceae bacterium]
MPKEALKDAGVTETAESKAEIPQKQAPKKEQKASYEPVYTAHELAANAKKVFGTKQECVAAALKAAGKTECTVAEAKGIVEKFLRKEVK